MVKLILEYDENKLDECIITYNDIIYKTEYFNNEYTINKRELIHSLHNLAQEAKYHVKNKIMSKKYWNIVIPINLCKNLCTRIEEMTDSSFEYIPMQTITINVSKLYDVYVDLLKDYHHYPVEHIFICPDDLKQMSDSLDIPDERFDVRFENIHIHYIPTINRSFIMDNYSLGR